MLDINITMLIQMVNFFIALYMLNILFIRPIRSILQERRAKMDGISGEADAFEREAEERVAAYQAALTRARQDATATREAARNEGLAQQQSIVGDAGRTAQEHLAKAQEAVRAEAAATLADLKTQVESLAGKLATRVMG